MIQNVVESVLKKKKKKVTFKSDNFCFREIVNYKSDDEPKLYGIDNTNLEEEQKDQTSASEK